MTLIKERKYEILPNEEKQVVLRSNELRIDEGFVIRSSSELRSIVKI